MQVGELNSFVIRLLKSSGGVMEPTESHGSLFLKSGYRETRAVGLAVLDRFGVRGTIAMHDVIASMLNDMAVSELSAAWSGIGDWQDRVKGGAPAELPLTTTLRRVEPKAAIAETASCSLSMRCPTIVLEG